MNNSNPIVVQGAFQETKRNTNLDEEHEILAMPFFLGSDDLDSLSGIPEAQKSRCFYIVMNINGTISEQIEPKPERNRDKRFPIAEIVRRLTHIQDLNMFFGILRGKLFWC